MMATAPITDVRAWARANGYDVKERGMISADIIDAYDDAHRAGPVLAGGAVIESSSYPDLDAGVTEADFPPAGDGAPEWIEPPGPDQPKPAKPTGGRRRRAPAKPKEDAKPRGPGGWVGRLFGGAGSHGRGRHARVSLDDFAQDTWTDLAWLAQPIPPLAKILTIQAPYAGVVFDEQVRGTVVDDALQPMARYAGVFRALNGLVGPPVYVGLICTAGRRVQVTGPDGAPVLYPPGHPEQGRPVLAYDARTQMMFTGLRYSLLQMTKIADVRHEEIQARTEEAAGRARTVDALIESIFAIDGPPQPVSPSGPAAGAQPGPGWFEPEFTYPEPPQMDSTGADPGRM